MSAAHGIGPAGFPTAGPRPLGLPAETAARGWWVGLDPPPATRERLAATLSADERARARRLGCERQRRRFVVRRGWLRAILGAELGLAPAAVVLAEGEHGKPRLAGAERRLRFSLSSSGGLAVYALAWDREVGIDVERLAPVPELPELAAHLFSPGERAHVRDLDGEARLAAFYRVWTRKEALVKAAGTGIAVPLAGIDTLAGPDAALLRELPTTPESVVAPWRDGDGGALPPGYVGALATAAPGRGAPASQDPDRRGQVAGKHPADRRPPRPGARDEAVVGRVDPKV